MSILQHLTRQLNSRRGEECSKKWEETFRQDKHKIKINAAAGRAGVTVAPENIPAGASGGDSRTGSSAMDPEKVRRWNEARQLAEDDFAACLRLSDEAVAAAASGPQFGV